jgi:hypothetical protein
MKKFVDPAFVNVIDVLLSVTYLVRHRRSTRHDAHLSGRFG